MALWALARLYPRLAIGLLLAAMFSGWYGVHKFNDWRHARSLSHVTAQRDQARNDAAIARHEAKQAEQSSAISDAAVKHQDAHARKQRAATAQASEAIHAQIQANPAACVPADDPVVRQHVTEAVSRAQAAADSVSGTPSG